MRLFKTSGGTCDAHRGRVRRQTPGSALADSWPANGPRVVWRKDVGEGFSGPVVTADRRCASFCFIALQRARSSSRWTRARARRTMAGRLPHHLPRRLRIRRGAARGAGNRRTVSSTRSARKDTCAPSSSRPASDCGTSRRCGVRRPERLLRRGEDRRSSRTAGSSPTSAARARASSR